MKDIELPPLSKFDHPEPRTMQCSDLELYAIKSYARAAVEADRAQRVPDVDALSNFIREIDGAHRFGAGALAERICEWLASTPAPAQQECWCETCDLAQGNPLGRTRMSLCPECGDKRCPRAKHHDNACAQHQEPPQQVRKPMTHIKEQARSYQVAQLAPTTGMVAISSAAYIELYERHHGIKE